MPEASDAQSFMGRRGKSQRPSHWSCRNGFATESAHAALQWAWGTVDTDRIVSMIRPDNARSIRVAEKLGEKFERADDINGEAIHVYAIHRRSSSV